jgi:Ion transport protein
MITLFVLSTLEGWPDYMYFFIDADETGPIKDSQMQFCWFFVVFILVGSLLLMNLFVGVILVNYHLAEENNSKIDGLNRSQNEWVDTQKLIVKSDPYFSIFYPPDDKAREIAFRIVNHKLFDPFIMVVILFNIITMAIQSEGDTDQFSSALDSINLTFTIIFILEAALKLVAFGILGYVCKNLVVVFQ